MGNEQHILEESIISLIEAAGNLAYERFTTGEMPYEQLVQVNSALRDLQSGALRLLTLMELSHAADSERSSP